MILIYGESSVCVLKLHLIIGCDNEIILTKDLTTKLESLAKENTKESQLEAGKLLSYEIVKNTIDSSDKVLKNS